MQLLRHYFISDNLDDLELFEEQLEAKGVSTPQIHVLSRHDEEVAHHEHLNYVQSFMQKDVIHSTVLGALVGLLLATFVIALAYVSDWYETPAGWIPFIFLSAVLLGFCTWEGGFFGIQKPNYQFARFEGALEAGRHIFFVDLRPDQEKILDQVLLAHPQVELAGTGSATPNWLINLQNKVPRFFSETFP